MISNKNITKMLIKIKTLNLKVTAVTLRFFSCFLIVLSLQGSGQNKIRKITLVHNVPIVSLEGELKNITDSLYIYYYRNDALFLFPYISAIEDDTSIISQQIKYKYFIYRKGELYGHFYDSITAAGYKKRKADSLLGSKAFLEINFMMKTTTV